MTLSYTHGTLTQVEEVEGGWEGGYPGPGVRLLWKEVSLSVQCALCRAGMVGQGIVSDLAWP